MDDLRVADWSGLTQWLESSGAERLELPFAEIERLIGDRFPSSSQYPAFWSNSSSYAKAWKLAGYESTRRGVPTGHTGFVRTRTLTAASATVEPPPWPGQSGPVTGEVVLVGCVKTKRYWAQSTWAPRNLGSLVALESCLSSRQPALGGTYRLQESLHFEATALSEC